MNPKKLFIKFPLLITIIANIGLLFAVFLLMRQVQTLLDSDAKINITEIVTQNKNVIASKLNREMYNLEMISSKLSDRYKEMGGTSRDDLKEVFLTYASDPRDEALFISTIDGTAIFLDEEEINISGRSYFRFGEKGIKNISEQMISRKTGEDIFVISVPIHVGDTQIGTVQRQYSAQEIYNICTISLFSEKGSMQIINSDGYILISSDQEGFISESDNYYRQLYLNNPKASKQLEADIKLNQSGFMETTANGRRLFSAYTPIDNVYDWYLITSVDTNAVSPNANIVIRLFFIILITVVLVFGGSIFYILALKSRQEAHVRKVAFVDTVTGGDTFSKFQYDFDTILKELDSAPIYLMSLDIDNFKYINKFYGFETGDRILRGIYRRYRAHLSSGERITRIYNDHFVLLLRNASPERLKQIFDPEISLEGIMIYFSAGLYPVADPTESINLMVDKANTAKQKVKGIRFKNIEVYSEDSDRQMIFNEQMKRSVERALAYDEIIPYYQPKVDINTRALVGAEALARWKTADGTIIYPNDFLPVCEKTGLIVSVDMMIFEKTLQFIKKSLDDGIVCVPISINFSRLHFLNTEFLQIILERLAHYQVPANLIEIEITETTIFENYESMEGFIHELHSHGLTISMDDFGSGYSSLHMLKDISIDVLKLDRGFLRSTEDSEKQRIVFASIAQMAHGLRIKVVVEGVENENNVELMKEFDCFIAQGYYYAKPMPQEDFKKFYYGGFV